MSSKSIQQLYSSIHAAEYLGIKENALRNSRVTGNLYGIQSPSFRKACKRIFYEKSELDKWIASLPIFNNTSQRD